MPPYKRKRTYKRKRYTNKPMKFLRSSSYLKNQVRVTRAAPSVRFMPQIVPDRALTKLKFSQGVAIASAGIAGYWIYRGNSLFDPDYTGAGNQPTGYDQWAQFYNSYRVSASSIKVIARSTQGNNEITMMVIQPRLDTTVDTDYLDMAADTYSKKIMLPNNTAGYYKPLKHYMTTRKIYGISKSKVQDDNYSAAVGSNPTNQWYWHIVVDDTKTGAINQDVNLYAEVTYYVEFYGRKELDQS